ncbi:MAG: hypothetical protein JXI43_06730, partial [Tissierellales bacterium]|nr:hypothetical protein [Tissierellales bacterium]
MQIMKEMKNLGWHTLKCPQMVHFQVPHDKHCNKFFALLWENRASLRNISDPLHIISDFLTSFSLSCKKFTPSCALFRIHSRSLNLPAHI